MLWKKIFTSMVIVSLSFNTGMIFASDYLNKVFTTPFLRVENAKFIDTVLRQIPSQDFYKVVDTIQAEYGDLSDEEWYEKLIERIPQIKSWKHPFNVIASLQHQKKILSAQARTLLGDKVVVNGYVEIGTPGTYLTSMQHFLIAKGKRYIINDVQRWSDYLQGYSLNPLNKFSPYDSFVEMHDYDPIPEDKIPSKSVDLVVCFIGLHHIPLEKLENFIASIQRILRPGGTFLLRDHDACTPELLSITYAAHSIFNVIATEETLETEKAEYRNFQPLAYWITALEKQGFYVDDQRLLQEGDPTKNTLLKFIRKPKTKDEEIEVFLSKARKNSQYKRDIIQTYLTSPEWHNVDVAQEYGSFINHTPFYEFPYMKSVLSYWKVFLSSWNIARKKKGIVAATLSQYTIMNLFIGASMTAEFTAKSAISWPIRTMISGVEDATLQMIVSDQNNEIGTIDERIKILNEQNNLKLIEVPRYKEFISIIKRIKNSNIVIKEIAGQKVIQCKVRYNISNIFPTEHCIGYKTEYTWTLPTQPTYVYAAVTVKVENIGNVINHFINNNIELLYIHDF